MPANPKWVAALTSGGYVCARGSMAKSSTIDGKQPACCLGVAAIEYAKEHGIEYTIDDDSIVLIYNDGDECVVRGCELPDIIGAWAGIPVGTTFLYRLAELNDDRGYYPLDAIAVLDDLNTFDTIISDHRNTPVGECDDR